MNDGEIRPTDVESPMWTTARHQVLAAGCAPGAEEGAEEDGAAEAGAAVAAAEAGAAVVDGLVVAVAGTVVPVEPVAAGPAATPVDRVLAPHPLSATTRVTPTRRTSRDEVVRG
jgi:hypothetical protein